MQKYDIIFKQKFKHREREIKAISCGDDINLFANEHALYFSRPQRELDVISQAVARLTELAEEHLTWHQLQIYRLILDGWSQTDISKYLGIYQASVHKMIFGNKVYQGIYRGKTHGGILAKLSKFCRKDKILSGLWPQVNKDIGSVPVSNIIDKHLE